MTASPMPFDIYRTTFSATLPSCTSTSPSKNLIARTADADAIGHWGALTSQPTCTTASNDTTQLQITRLQLSHPPRGILYHTPSGTFFSIKLRWSMISPSTEKLPFPMAWQTLFSRLSSLYQMRVASSITRPCFFT